MSTVSAKPFDHDEAIVGMKTLRVRDPDELLAGVNRSILGRALVISVVAHAALFGFSSFSLYEDWAKYGVWREDYKFVTPADIREIQKIEREKEAEAKREEAAEARKQERLKDAEAAKKSEKDKGKSEGEVEGPDSLSPDSEILSRAAPGTLDDPGLSLEP